MTTPDRWLDEISVELYQDDRETLLRAPVKSSAPNIEGPGASRCPALLRTFEIEALRDHIETLKEQLVSAQAELAVLRPKASEAVTLKATRAALDAQMVVLILNGPEQEPFS